MMIRDNITANFFANTFDFNDNSFLAKTTLIRSPNYMTHNTH